MQNSTTTWKSEAPFYPSKHTKPTKSPLSNAMSVAHARLVARLVPSKNSVRQDRIGLFQSHRQRTPGPLGRSTTQDD
jgi:hypothetical protein